MDLSTEHITNDYIDSKEIYNVIEHESLDTYESDLDYDCIINTANGIHHAMIRKLSAIEQFTNTAISTDLPAFEFYTNIRGRISLKRHPLSKHYTDFNNLREYLSDDYSYSAKVDLFLECYNQLNLDSHFFTWHQANEAHLFREEYERFNSLIDLIRTQSKKDSFARRLKGQQDKVNRRLKAAHTHISNLIDKRCKLLVLRIDFSYRKDLVNQITLDEVKNDLEHFLSNRRNKPSLFSNMDGYIWKLEYGPDKGYHYHLLLFFNGSKHQNDYYLAKEIGEYWKHCITKGRGIYFNCNAKKSDYWYIGIGMIRRDDDMMIFNLKHRVVGYLVKSDQYLMAKLLGNNRCFGMGAA